MTIKENNNLVIFQAKDGALEIKMDNNNETVWATQAQMASIFDVNTQAITKHIKNIYDEGELEENPTCSILEQVQIEGERKIKRKIKFYNLDLIISVGYRINSIQGTRFRQWATKTLKQHITQGFTINSKVLENHTAKFLEAMEAIKQLSQNTSQIDKNEVLDLVKVFAKTWFSLDKYDKDSLPKSGSTKTEIVLSSRQLYQDIQAFKQDLISQNQATDLFAMEKNSGNLEGVFGNVFQTAFGQDVYPTLEEKAAHLLYFIIKNHPFNDGNKRTGAFSFVWFLQHAGIQFANIITPETLTSITLLIAESKPEDKDKMVGLVLLLLNK